MNTIFTSKALIRFSDCDPLGHLNNMRYLDYFLNAREDQLAEFADFNIYEHSKQTGRIWVMFQNKITYLKPVFYNNFVTITSRMIRYEDKSIQVEMQMMDPDTKELKCVLWMIAVYIDVKIGKSVAHEPEIQSRFQTLLNPVEQTTFDERVRYLQSIGKDTAGV